MHKQLTTRIELLQERINQLQDELTVSVTVINQLEESCINKSRFLEAAIHDLRQPLQTLCLLSDSLANAAKDENSSKFAERLGNAVTAASNTLNRLSEIARLDAGRADAGACVSRKDEAADERSAAERSILLVADDPNMITALEIILATEGCQISVAADGWQALELASHGTKWPDLVIADDNLPNGLSGRDVIASLQERLDHDVGAIVLTGGVSSSVSRVIEDRGCFCLGKPVKARELMDLVRLVLGGRHATVAHTSLEAGGQESPTVFLVDDDPAILEAMGDLLKGDGCSVEAFTSGSAFFSACGSHRNGCVLVDAFMPGMDGFELIGRLRAESYALPVIMITGAGDVRMAVRAMKAGAADFIEKPVSAQELVNCVRNALKPAPGVVTASSRQQAAAERFATLTERQRQIIELILAGEPNKIIAVKLGLSQRTVESHRAAIMRKTGARSFAALVRWAIAAS